MITMMIRDRPFLPRWPAALLALLILSCMLAAAFAFAFRPTPIKSHEDQIARVLHERGIPYDQITLGERWPDHINFQYGSNVFPYGFQVLITFRNRAPEQGWLECRKLEQDCTLSIKSLGINHAELADFTRERPAPWNTWLGWFNSLR